MALSGKSEFLTRTYDWLLRGLPQPTSENLRPLYSVPSKWPSLCYWNLPNSNPLRTFAVFSFPSRAFFKALRRADILSALFLAVSPFLTRGLAWATQHIWWISKSHVAKTDIPGRYVLFPEKRGYLFLDRLGNIGHMRPQNACTTGP